MNRMNRCTHSAPIAWRQRTSSKTTHLGWLLKAMFLLLFAFATACTGNRKLSQQLPPIPEPDFGSVEISQPDSPPAAKQASRPIPGRKNTVDSERINAYVGLSEIAAKALATEQNRIFRVGRRDDESFPLTADYRRGRITAYLENGVVTAVQIE